MSIQPKVCYISLEIAGEKNMILNSKAMNGIRQRSIQGFNNLKQKYGILILGFAKLFSKNRKKQIHKINQIYQSIYENIEICISKKIKLINLIVEKATENYPEASYYHNLNKTEVTIILLRVFGGYSFKQISQITHKSKPELREIVKNLNNKIGNNDRKKPKEQYIMQLFYIKEALNSIIYSDNSYEILKILVIKSNKKSDISDSLYISERALYEKQKKLNSQFALLMDNYEKINTLFKFKKIGKDIYVTIKRDSD